MKYKIFLMLLVLHFGCANEDSEPSFVVEPADIVGSWKLVSEEKNGEMQNLTVVHGNQCEVPYIWTFDENGDFESTFCIDFPSEKYPWEIVKMEDERFLLVIDIGRSWFHGGYILQLDENILKFERPDFNNLGDIRIRTFERSN